MKNRTIFLAIVLAVIFGLASPASAQSRFGFKLSGGMGYIGGGDVNDGLQGIADLYEEYFASAPGILTLNGYEPFHWGMDIAGEFFFHIDPKFAIGLGTGYLPSSKESSLTLTDGSDATTWYWHPKVNAVPLTLNLHYFVPAGGRVKFVLTVGAGLYLTKLDLDQGFGSGLQQMKLFSSGFGVHGGLGLEIGLSPHVSITADFLGRFVRVGGLGGESTESGVTESDGRLWYLEVVAPTGTYPMVIYHKDVPSGAPMTNVREAKLGLSGFSAALGFLFRL